MDNLFVKNANRKYVLGDNWILRNDEFYKNKYTLYNINTNQCLSLNYPLFVFFKILSQKPLSYTEFKEFLRANSLNFDWNGLFDIIDKWSLSDLFLKYDDLNIIPQRNYNIPLNFSPNVSVANSPINIEIHLTHKCNLKCLHCFQESTPNDRCYNELNIETWLSIFDQLENLNARIISISGGEPLYYKYFDSLINKIVQKRFAYNILTNGLLVNDRNINALSSSNVQLNISLDGYNAELHDYIRGKGSFDRLLFNLKELVKKKANIKISTTLYKKNIPYIENLINLVVKLGIKYIGFALVEPSGRATHNPNILLSDSDIHFANNVILSLKEKFKSKIGIETFDIATIASLPNNQSNIISCAGGTSYIAICSDGLLYPCIHAFQYKELAIGDLRYQKIIDLWRNNSLWGNYRGNLILQDIDGCKDCEFALSCNQKNCRVKSYYKKKSLLSKPNYCLKDRIPLQ